MAQVVYTVQPSDEDEGLPGIAGRLYGDRNRWPQIFDANRPVIGNNPSFIHFGQQLVIPGLQDERVTREGMRIYVVQTMDIHEGLKGIARRLCGDERKWKEIYGINRSVIGNGIANLQVGQILIIP